jgi:hypothetical protein
MARQAHCSVWAAQEEQALKTLIPDAAAICEQVLRDAGIAPNAEATAAAAQLPTPSIVEQPGKAAAPAEKLQVLWTASKVLGAGPRCPYLHLLSIYWQGRPIPLE